MSVKNKPENQIEEISEPMPAPIIIIDGKEFKVNYGMAQMQKLSSNGMLGKGQYDMFGDTVTMIQIGVGNNNPASTVVKAALENAMKEKQIIVNGENVEKLVGLFAILVGYMGECATELGFI